MIRSSEGATAGLGRGAVAGGVSTTVFTVLHHVFINPIWWMFPVMLVAGAACGACLVWCYSELVDEPSPKSWLGYVVLFTVMFGLLAVASVIIYEPTITMTEMLESTEATPSLMGDTIGLMTVFTISWSGVLVWLYRKRWRAFGVGLATTTVLMLFLGFNVSTIGLVEFPTEARGLMAGFFGYIAALGLVFGAAFALLVRWPSSPTAP